MKHLDLFSGIGGFALATEMVWDDVEHIFCDKEPFAQAVLSKHWPNSKIYGDIRTLTNTRREHGGAGCSEGTQRETCEWCSAAEETQRFGSIDIVTGGFPCQPFSQAGARRGTEDNRYLWPEMLRIIREFHPRWVVGENVGGLVTWNEGLVLEQIHTDLEGEGYEVQAFIIPACALNAPHRRDRVWIIAHSESSRPNTGFDTSKRNKTNIKYDSENRQQRKQQGLGVSSSDSDASNPQRTGHTGKEYKAGQSARYNRREQQQEWNQNWVEVATCLCRVDDGVPRRVDRNPRLKALGNAIVPQIAAEIFKAIKEVDK